MEMYKKELLEIIENMSEAELRRLYSFAFGMTVAKSGK